MWWWPLYGKTLIFFTHFKQIYSNLRCTLKYMHENVKPIIKSIGLLGENEHKNMFDLIFKCKFKTYGDVNFYKWLNMTLNRVSSKLLLLLYAMRY